MDAAIEIRNASKRFGETQAVDDLSLTVPTGSLTGFLGPNGAGKTTTIRMIMSIIFPDSGEIRVLGKASAIESKDQIGYLPEERGLYRKMKVGEFLTFMAGMKGVDTPAAKLKSKDWLERLGLGHTIKKKCEELSKGMQQKVQFIATLIHEPELIILDEPFSGLDPVNARTMRELIVELSDAGRTFIFSTHVLHQAEQMCDRIVLINKGKKLLDDTLANIRQQFDPRTLIVSPRNGDIDLAGFPSVLDVRRLHGEFEVSLTDGADPYAVMRQLMEHAELRKVELRQLSLDDVFISMVSDVHINELGGLEVAADA